MCSGNGRKLCSAYGGTQYILPGVKSSRLLDECTASVMIRPERPTKYSDQSRSDPVPRAVRSLRACGFRHISAHLDALMGNSLLTRALIREILCLHSLPRRAIAINSSQKIAKPQAEIFGSAGGIQANIWPFSAARNRTFRLILLDRSKHPTPGAKMRVLRLRSRARTTIYCSSIAASAITWRSRTAL